MNAPEPVAMWDANTPQWGDRCCLERVAWAKANIPQAVNTYHVEFFVVDMPFAVVYRYATTPDGRYVIVNGQASLADPVTVPLEQLPPDHLLKFYPRAQVQETLGLGQNLLSEDLTVIYPL